MARTNWIHASRSAALRALLVLAAASPLSAQSVWHVDAAAPLGGDGTSWSQAFKVLDRGLRAARVGDSVWVAEGTYKPVTRLSASDPRSATFFVPQGVELYGGFAGHEQSLAQRAGLFGSTVLSGDLGAPGDPSDNAYHVVRVYFPSGIPPGVTRIDGFTITGGNANVTGGPSQGGGLLVFNSALVLADCTFRENTALDGGALHTQVGALALLRCTFTDNEALDRGGAFATFNTGLLDVHGTYARNRADRGGAVFARGYSNASGLRFASSLFHDNHADRGGAVLMAGTAGLTVPGRGTFSGCTFSMNSAASQGGAIRSTAVTDPTRIHNSILWRNTAPDGAELNGEYTVSHSLVRGGAAGPGNISANPGFRDAVGRDFRLRAGSPCIDAGDNSLVLADHLDVNGNGDFNEPLPWDHAGEPRFVDDPATPDTGSGAAPIVDIGAHEYQLQ